MNLLDLVVTVSAEDRASAQISSISTGMITQGVATGNLIAKGIEVGAQAIQRAIQLLGDFVKDSIATGMEFDKSMSQVAATMGVTTDEIQNLRDFALDMGASTSFSASQAADALNYMALAGYDAETSMQMLPNVLNLAAAGGMELATASDMVTDSQTALGLSLEETNALVDQMAKASSTTNTSVSQLGDAILTVGGTAKSLSGGITEMNTVLGLMADNGIKGAEAGTHLRNIILSLSAPTDTAAKAMAELGISAVDADGNFRPLEETMADFNAAFADMTAAEKTQALNTIFNKTDLASVNALLDTNADRWAEVSDGISNAAGAAQQMADTQLDNLAGDITLMQSAIEGTQVAISDLLTPSLRELAGTAGQAFSSIAEQLRNGDIAGAAEAFGRMIGDLATYIIAHIPDILDAMHKLVNGMAIGLTSALPEMIPAVVQMITGIISTFIENLPLFVQAAIQLALGIAVGLVNAIPQILMAVPQIIGAIVSALIELGPAIIDAFATIFAEFDLGEFLMGLLATVAEWALQLGSMALEAGGAFVDGLVQFLTGLPGTVAGFLASIISNVGGWVANMAANAVQAGSQFLSGVVEFLSQLPGRIAGFLANIISNIIGWVASMGEQAIQAGSSFLSGVSNAFVDVISFFAGIPGRILGALGDLGSLLLDAGSQIIGGLVSGITGAIGGAISAVTEGIGGIVGAVTDFLGIHSPSRVFAGIGRNTILGLEEGIGDEMSEPVDMVTAMARQLNEAASGIGPDWDISAKVEATSAKGIVGAAMERTFSFTVNVNNTGEARSAGRAIGEALYEEFARLERSALYA